MIAVILAAGIASRLRPLTDVMPKSLLTVRRKPLLQWTLEALYGNHVNRCIIVTGHRREMIEEFVGRLPFHLDISFIFNEQFNTTNNNYSLWLAGREVKEDMVMMDADILFDTRILTRLLASDHPNVLVIRTTRHLGEEEIKVQVDGQGTVVRIGKEIPPHLAAGESLGIEKFSRSTAEQLFVTLERRRSINEFYEASFQEMIDHGTLLHTIDTDNLPCIEIDTPEDLAAAESLALSINP